MRAAVGAALGVEVLDARPVHGGDVAAAFRTELADGRTVFAKTRPGAPAGFFSTEADGLAWLGAAEALSVPAVLAVADSPVPLLVLGWIDVGAPGPHTDADLGRALAALHRAGAASFGRDDRRPTGSLGMPNEPCRSWAEFFASQRLEPLARLAHDAGALGGGAVAGLERLATGEVLASLPGADEPAARLHGDLWAGNRLVDTAGRNWLIDPAAHGGHREFDLAMMALFGGFGAACFAAYESAHPLAEGWQERASLHQIAPLVVHAIKFGGSYVAAATAAIARWS